MAVNILQSDIPNRLYCRSFTATPTKRKNIPKATLIAFFCKAADLGAFPGGFVNINQMLLFYSYNFTKLLTVDMQARTRAHTHTHTQKLKHSLTGHTAVVMKST